ncbi:hypothetical protein LIER_30905 [Lithospermum erythrorhizon]|uniref:Uncharacterized protein n=1 Tax=Lithospermum erythrorhizon TaxID=34254 RepID=A0AAV3RPA9_LITER
MQQVLGSKDSTSAPTSSKGAVSSVQEEPASNLQEEAPKAPERLEAPMPEKPLEEPLVSSPVQCIWYPGKPNQGKPSYPRRSPDHSMGFMPIGSKEGYKSDHPYFVDTPYVLPSGVEVSTDFPGISTYFEEYVSSLGDNYVVDIFDDLPDDDAEDIGADDGDSDASEGENDEDDAE